MFRINLLLPTSRHAIRYCSAQPSKQTLMGCAAQLGQQLNYHGWRNDYRQKACVYSIITSATDEFFHAQLYTPRCTAGFDVTFRQTFVWMFSKSGELTAMYWTQYRPILILSQPTAWVISASLKTQCKWWTLISSLSSTYIGYTSSD